MNQDEIDQYVKDNTLAGAGEKLHEALASLWREVKKILFEPLPMRGSNSPLPRPNSCKPPMPPRGARTGQKLK